MDFKVALVPSRIFVKHEDKYYPQEPAQDDVLLVTRSFDHFDICIPDSDHPDHVSNISRWCEQFKKRAAAAVNSGAKFVVFGELSYPNFWPGRPEPVGALEKRRELDLLKLDLSGYLKNLAQQSGSTIISGSYHDTDTFENLCHLHIPFGASYRHKKLTCARAVGEDIKLPRGNQFPVYKIGDIIFCVLICSDAFDLNMFFRQLCRDTNHPDVLPQIFFRSLLSRGW